MTDQDIQDMVRSSRPYSSAPQRLWSNLKQLRSIISNQVDHLKAGHTTDQYIALRNVTRRDMDQINRNRSTLGHHVKFGYYINDKALIIKLMPSLAHDLAHRLLASEIEQACRGMGVPRRTLVQPGLTTCSAVNKSSSKEADSAFIPLPARADWPAYPTLIIDSGTPDSLPRLRDDARWWLVASEGQVKIALLVAIDLPAKTIAIEKWVDTAAGTRSEPRSSGPPRHHQSAFAPACVATIKVVPKAGNPASTETSFTVTGCPMALEFDQVFLRPPVGSEGDILIGQPFCQDLATIVWSGFEGP